MSVRMAQAVTLAMFRCPAAHACMCERGNALEDFGACSEIFVCRDDGIDLICNLAKVTFDLFQTSFDLQGKQFVRGRGKSCFCCSPVFYQCQPGSCQLLEIMKRFAFRRVYFQLKQRAHHRQHGSIYPVCLCQLACTLAEPAGLTRIDPRKADPMLGQSRFEKPVIYASGFKNHPSYPNRTRPKRKGFHALLVIAKLSVFSIGKPVGVQFVFRDADSDGIVHLSFPHLILSYGPKAQVSVQVDRKDGGDHTRAQSAMTKRGTVRPPPLPGINAVPGSCSSFAQELLNS